MGALKNSFYRAIQRVDVPGALTRYGELRRLAEADKHMTSALIGICAQKGKHGLVQRLWKAHDAGNGATPLSVYLYGDFIKGFARLEDHEAATYVMQSARSSNRAQIEVYNA